MTTTVGKSTEPLKVVRRFADSHGDVWAATWADDGSLYALSDDSQGFEDSCSSNVAMNQITGDSVDELRGRTINPLSEFGALGELGEDNATWKGTGLLCADGVLYLAVSRHRYGTPPYQIQQTWDGLIVASEDHGRTWQEPEQRPTFPGRLFSNPNFVQYGQDGRPPAGRDDGYIYAVSNDGSWNNGSTMALGRVRRERQHVQDPDSWEFWAGTNAEGEPIWSPNINHADFIMRSPGRTSMTGVTYLKELDRYCMPQWHYLFDHKSMESDWPAAIFNSPTRVEFFTAESLWGPWTLRHSFTSPEGWYNPCILAKPMEGLQANSVPVFAAGIAGGEFEFYNLNVLELPLELLQE